VNAWQPLARIFALSAVGASSSSVSAEELALASRSSIAIGVTIPTRLLAKPLYESETISPLQSGWDAQALCVLTNSHGATYSVVVLPAPDATDAASGQRSGEGATLSVDWADQRHGLQSTNLRPGEAVGGFPAAVGHQCPRGATGTPRVTVKATVGAKLALNSLPAQLTLLIAPE